MRHLLLIVLLAIAPTIDGKTYTYAQLKEMFVQMPPPDYPYEIRSRGITGSGVFRLYVDEQGKVTQIKILETTHNHALDAEALKAFIRWRAKSGPKREVDVPATFSRRHG